MVEYYTEDAANLNTYDGKVLLEIIWYKVSNGILISIGQWAYINFNLAQNTF